MIALVLLGSLLQHATTVEVEPRVILKPSGGLGTTAYAPRPTEKGFLDRAPKEEQVPGPTEEEISGAKVQTYSIRGKKEKVVTWFGIVRRITAEGKEEDAPRTLLVENKYFDGLVDTHLLVLSFNGGGDFAVKVGKSKEKIDPLVLVRVYGKVIEEKGGVPTVRADYVRVWPWTTFAFIGAYGEDRSNPEWRKLCKVDLEDIYEPLPDGKYYVERLGPLPKK
ncbi:MAG TPA: hypothetical protein VFI25_06370 [Planctomycetota bacterium]|jgi:hypothetical protein|nr:hypothetical protein [Planctomycetota bacterium]